MKKIVILLVVILSLVSCEYLWNHDDDFPDTEASIIQISIGNSGFGDDRAILEYSLGEFTQDRGASFKIRGEHYSISELHRNLDTQKITFRYQPQEGFRGEDYVEIITQTDSEGNPILGISKTLHFYIEVKE